MKLFLDTSALIAACGGPTGASRYITDNAFQNGWHLLTSAFVLDEVNRNVFKLGDAPAAEWRTLATRLEEVPDVFAFSWVAIFPVPKDRPVLFTAAAFADVLITLDHSDFIDCLGSSFFRLAIQTPFAFVRAQRHVGHIKP